MTQSAPHAPSVFDKAIRTTSSESLITRYYQGIQLASAELEKKRTGNGFCPPFEYPDLTDDWEQYFSPAGASWEHLDDYGGKRVVLLDLMKNPEVRTTKTTASLLMVARAVHHIRRTGESILIFCPSSGNKAVALRDAVARAIDLGLAAPDELRIATFTPARTTYKFRRNLLTESEELRRLNPILVLDGPQPAAVKELGQEFVRAAQFGGPRTCRVWYTLDIANYKVADACRAFFEYEFGGADPAHRRRLHAHAVSSAYGLLGYQHGLGVLARLGLPIAQPGFLLVQHLATSDMVAHHLSGGAGFEMDIDYQPDPETGLLRQQASPHFPYATWSLGEDLEPTFYTKTPVTSPEMTGLIAAHGGTGIVVSLYECLTRYSLARQMLALSGCELPADPRTLAEWSLVMVLTGMTNAADRALIDQFNEVVVHGSGMYPHHSEHAVSRAQTVEVGCLADMLRAVPGTQEHGRI
ncbi:hypothetical protein CLV63_12187 [Murinocardiopsis flavida]|uniref:Uncharacterized protein n=1 Tax=Murinocardiopsis flavida TaxID=645275 RepID=A0A2P8D158_9ACTN|nr:DUF6002 family protein [Murinocardiopsis flavida]PSK90960.1 hypothetical protein CLV63_12187 [Murinocardiopsis flavida]